MTPDPRARERFQAAFDVAGQWMESAEAAVQTGRPALIIEACHLAVHNAVVAFGALKVGRGGRLRHKEVGARAAELQMLPELVDGVNAVEGLHIPVSYGSPTPTEEQARRALQITRRVMAYVRGEAKNAGALAPRGTHAIR